MAKYRIVQFVENGKYFIQEKTLFGWKYTEDWTTYEHALMRYHELTNKGPIFKILVSDDND